MQIQRKIFDNKEDVVEFKADIIEKSNKEKYADSAKNQTNKSMQIQRKIFDNKEDWKDFRAGFFTSSKINNLMAKGKRDDGLSVGAISYIIETISDKLTPRFEIHNNSVDWGLENEPQAVLRYAEDNGLDVNSDDFIYTSVGGHVFFHVDDVLGGTPDIILNDKIVEIKCPNTDTHLYNMFFVDAGNVQKEYPIYYDQCQLNMLLTERKKTILMSYDPRVPTEMQAHYITIEYDSLRVEEILNKINSAHKLKQKLWKSKEKSNA